MRLKEVTVPLMSSGNFMFTVMYCYFVGQPVSNNMSLQKCQILVKVILKQFVHQGILGSFFSNCVISVIVKTETDVKYYNTM